MDQQQITILGSTGSIGTSTLDVIRRNKACYSVFALTANTSINVLYNQCLEFNPQFAVLQDEDCAHQLRKLLLDSNTIVLSGADGLCEVACHEQVQIVMAAIVGAAGLTSTLAAAKSGKRLLLANKESLVMSGRLFMDAVRENGATLMPIDSEHNAIFQSMANGAEGYASGVSKLLLTGSGGPLLNLPMQDMSKVTPSQACAHPNFSMGKKISVDSATMMNKGLELIEATWLFDMPADKIQIVLHPQQIIHSMVEYVDGSILAQMGNPDMKTPIAHGLAWPARIDAGVASLDFLTMGHLEFKPLERERFPCIALAESVATGPSSCAIALNAANEIAVDAFLHELIRFIDIPHIVESVLEKAEAIEVESIGHTLDLDLVARTMAEEQLKGLVR